MLSTLAAIIFAFLATAQVAFGWMPCCCGIATSCCSEKIPTVLHGTLTSAGCAGSGWFDGQTITFTWNGVSSVWQGAFALSSCANSDTPSGPPNGFFSTYTFVFSLACISGQWKMTLLTLVSGGSGFQTNPCCQLLPTGTTIDDTSTSCAPLSIQFDYTSSLSGSPTDCPCDGSTVTLTITP